MTWETAATIVAALIGGSGVGSVLGGIAERWRARRRAPLDIAALAQDVAARALEHARGEVEQAYAEAGRLRCELREARTEIDRLTAEVERLSDLLQAAK